MFLDVQLLKSEHEKFLKLHEFALTAALDDAEAAAIEFVNTKPGFNRQTGKTQAKTRTKVLNRRGKKIVLRVSNSSKIASILEKGSKRHPIVARPGKMLRFWGFGQVVYRKRVMHAGTKAYRFLSRARNRAGIEFERSMTLRMNRAAPSF